MQLNKPFSCQFHKYFIFIVRFGFYCIPTTYSTDSASLGFNKSDNDITAEVTMKALERFLRPEFIGRVDEVIRFRPLGKDELSAIAEKYLRSTESRAAERGVTVRFDSSVAGRLVSLTDGRKYGARQLRRLVTTVVDDDLAERISSGAVLSGDAFSVSWDGASLVYDKI